MFNASAEVRNLHGNEGSYLRQNSVVLKLVNNLLFSNWLRMQYGLSILLDAVSEFLG